MELVLLRHGQAQERGADIPDADRQLTKKGRYKMNKAALGLQRLLKGCSHVRIWTSPLSRARETAEIMAAALGTTEITEHMAIMTGDLEKLASGWKEYDDDVCLVVVGHEPYLSAWSSKICGGALSFKKGAAAGFTIDCRKGLEGKLRWFAQPGVLVRL